MTTRERIRLIVVWVALVVSGVWLCVDAFAQDRVDPPLDLYFRQEYLGLYADGTSNGYPVGGYWKSYSITNMKLYVEPYSTRPTPRTVFTVTVEAYGHENFEKLAAVVQPIAASLTSLVYKAERKWTHSGGELSFEGSVTVSGHGGQGEVMTLLNHLYANRTLFPGSI